MAGFKDFSLFQYHVGVGQEDAQKLIFGQKAGELYLAILAQNAQGQPLAPTKLKDVTAP